MGINGTPAVVKLFDGKGALIVVKIVGGSSVLFANTFGGNCALTVELVGGSGVPIVVKLLDCNDGLVKLFDGNGAPVVG